MTERPCRGGRLCRPSAFLLLVASVFIVCAHAVSQAAEFLVIEHPKFLIAYDSFQQSLTAGQRETLRPFMPMKILEAHDVLGDGFTRCTKVDAEGNILYLLEDENGALANRKSLGLVKKYAGKEILQDTIAILVPDKMLFTDAAGGKSVLSEGDRCIRYFSEAGSWYVKRLGRPPVYGWIKSSETKMNEWWGVVRPEAVRTDFSPALLERIDGRIRQANQTLVQVYAVLNRETGKRLTPPRWSINRRGESLRIALLPDSTLKYYPKSVDALNASLQTYVLGTGFDVTSSGNEITIRSR